METRNKRKVIIIVVAILVLVVTIGGAYALWTYSKTLGDQTLISGDIYMKYTEGDTVNIKEAMPSVTYNPDDYFEFSVEGKNKYKKDIVFEILLDEGDAPTGKENETRNVRIKPELLKFRLVEVKGKEEEELIQAGSYDNLNQKRIWVDRVEANTTSEIKYTYRLYMWISNDTKIGNMEGADYTAEVWNNNVFASVKVGVNGDFEEKELTEDYFILNAKNESGEPYDLNTPVQSDEDITLTLASKREVTKFVVSKSEQYPIALMSLEEPTDYTASYNETTRAWEATITLDETGIYDYYAVYPDNKGNSKTYSFTLLFNPDRFVKVERPTSALCKQGLTYTGSPQDLIDESNLDKEGYTITQVQGTDAKSYEVKAKLKEKFRWSDSSMEDSMFNCTIGPKTTELTYEPTAKLIVAKGTKRTVKITAPTEGTFEVTSQATGTASVTFTPASGTSTTVTVQGEEEGATSLDVKFTPSNNNYTEITDIYSIEVTKEPAVTQLKEKLGEGGLIGVTTDNTMTIDKGASNIREYRYSGVAVNNYVYFNCSDTESEPSETNCETWRIIGIFKDESGQEHMKIVRNEVLSVSEMPDTYEASGKVFHIVFRRSYSSYLTHWSAYGEYSYYNNNWADAGLMYWLNSLGTDSENQGYLKTLPQNDQDMISKTKYYLGTLTFNSGINDTPVEAYNYERAVEGCSENKGPSTNNSKSAVEGNSTCRVWANNAAYWEGKIALMYPSDYGFTADSQYWKTTKLYGRRSESEEGFNVQAAKTSWIYNDSKFKAFEWFLSPSSDNSIDVAYLAYGNTVYGYNTSEEFLAGTRPALYLKSDVQITGEGTGESTNPYQLSCNTCTES